MNCLMPNMVKKVHLNEICMKWRHKLSVSQNNYEKKGKKLASHRKN